MNLQELVTKVTEDKSETPYITIDDIKGVSAEVTEKDTKIQTLSDEIANVKEELEKKKSEYDLLKSRIVDSVLSGKTITNTDDRKKEEDNNSDRDKLTFNDLIKK